MASVNMALQLKIAFACVDSNRSTVISEATMVMTFKIGDRVKRKVRDTYLRLSFPGTETGTVVSLRRHPGEVETIKLDVKLDNGELVRGVAHQGFERIGA